MMGSKRVEWLEASVLIMFLMVLYNIDVVQLDPKGIMFQWLVICSNQPGLFYWQAVSQFADPRF